MKTRGGGCVPKAKYVSSYICVNYCTFIILWFLFLFIIDYFFLNCSGCFCRLNICQTCKINGLVGSVSLIFFFWPNAAYVSRFLILDNLFSNVVLNAFQCPSKPFVILRLRSVSCVQCRLCSLDCPFFSPLRFSLS